MAGPEDFFSPGPWQDPRLQAGMLQAGLQLMTGPRTWGGGPMAGVADAIGGGAEAIGRQETALQRQQEVDSKEALRAAQSEAAGARAGAASQGLETQRQRLALMGQEVENKQFRNVAGNRIRLGRMYQDYVKGVNAQNAAIDKNAGNVLLKPDEKAAMLGGKQQPLNMDQWVQSNPVLRTMGLLEDTGGAGPGATQQGPKPGDLVKGYRFKGGDPSDQGNWEPQ